MNTSRARKPIAETVNQAARMNDPVNHPTHYTSHPSGVEAITITEHMTFCVGNAIKYLFRHEHKGQPIEDLEKARWYIDREIARLKSHAA